MTQSVFPDVGAFPWGRARPTIARVSTALSTLQTVVSVAGRGIAKVGVTSGDPMSTRPARVVITVDGVVIADVSGAALAWGGLLTLYGTGGTEPTVDNFGRMAGLHSSVSQAGAIGFRSSFLMQISTTSGSSVVGFAEVLTV